MCHVTLAVYTHTKASLVFLHLCDVMLISHIMCHANDTKGVIGELGEGGIFFLREGYLSLWNRMLHSSQSSYLLLNPWHSNFFKMWVSGSLVRELWAQTSFHTKDPHCWFRFSKERAVEKVGVPVPSTYPFPPALENFKYTKWECVSQ